MSIFNSILQLPVSAPTIRLRLIQSFLTHYTPTVKCQPPLSSAARISQVHVVCHGGHVFIMSDPTFSYIDMAVYMHFDELCPTARYLL